MAKAKGTDGAKSGKIRVGIGGWTFEPWRGEFYPKGLPHARELTYASERLTSIEINGTFYRTQIARHLRQVGQGDAGGLRVLREGRALRHQPQGARGSGGIGRSLSQVGRAGAGRQARPDPLAVHADQEVRSRRLRRLPRAAAEVAAGPHAAPCRGGAARLVLRAGVRRPAAQARDRRWCLPSTPPIRRSPIRSATSSICDCRRARTASPPAIRPRSWTPGPSAPRPGPRAARPRTWPLVDDEQGRQGCAARRVRLLHPRGQGAGAGRRRWNDQAGWSRSCWEQTR